MPILSLSKTLKNRRGGGGVRDAKEHGANELKF